ncbi:glycerophosphodiester phosphodiesterase [Aeromicrobium sp. PE09-221]|uniref:glycerophosphodiester phosphodiesterase n=1 Tax=Aeromicrobium sp. PE09-221 TaxID=1898043 RepID=UPI000B3E5EF8|nr:glycerophosphodiester phosphodiesterase [Aeromicrobium sp. PE09-221]
MNRRSPYLDAPTPLAFAHRGGAHTAGNAGIENSLAAFRHAVELGYRYLETDTRATRDGVAYACHDARLTRLTGDERAIGDLTSAELDAMLLGDREPIVRLDALMTALPEARFNIDVKSGDAIEPTCQVIERLDATDRVCLASFSHQRLNALRSRLPGATFSASSRQVARMVIGLGIPSGVDCLQVPVARGSVPIVTRRFLRRAHAAGIQVHVWTIDDPVEMHRLLDLGVDGIMSDRTDLLKDVLIERGEWNEGP